jgi:hypothetical protein
MPSQAEYPFEEYKLYVVFHKKMKRRMACLVSKENRTTISYARYLMSVHLGRKLTKIETVDHIDGDTLNDSLENLQILSNEDNIKKIGIKSIDLFLLPKNKKIYLTNLIDEIFEDLQVEVVFDKLRLNPFYEDSLYSFIKDNQEKFSKNIIQTYLTRSKDLNYLLREANIDHQIYETSFLLARKNKIIDYWTNIWGQSTNYKDSTLIEHLIIK